MGTWGMRTNGKTGFDIIKKTGYLFMVILILLTTVAAAEDNTEDNSNSVDTADQEDLNKITYNDVAISGDTFDTVSFENVEFNNVVFNNVTFINVSINTLIVNNLTTVSDGLDAGNTDRYS